METGRILKRSRLDFILFHHWIAEYSDILDFDFNDVAMNYLSNSAGCSGTDEIARIEGEILADKRDHFSN